MSGARAVSSAPSIVRASAQPIVEPNSAENMRKTTTTKKLVTSSLRKSVARSPGSTRVAFESSMKRATTRPSFEATHRWRVRTRLPERFGQACRVLLRGRMNTVIVEFDDGHRVATSRWNVRRV
jgi:hypothetical protein